jgi:hypothetical protein
MNEGVGLTLGELCNRNGCKGIIEEHEKGGCSCHITPPCSACVEPRAFCPVCEWDDKEEQEENKVNKTEAIPVLQKIEHKTNSTIIENGECKLEIFRNPKKHPEHANAYYEVKLLSGKWPQESLISICDNSGFNKGSCHFGGRESDKSRDYVFVTVYVD